MQIFGRASFRRHWPALVIAVLMAVYLFLFLWPDVRYLFHSLRTDLRYISDLGPSLCLVGLAELLCMVAGIAVWVLSVFVTWAAFSRSRKKAYLFLLAYFLMPMVVQPISHTIKYMTRKPIVLRDEAARAAEELGLVEPAPARSPYFVQERNINLPVGPLLLLAGIWYLYRNEECKAREPSTGEHSHAVG